jgi:retron-type reverse transcriptase
MPKKQVFRKLSDGMSGMSGRSQFVKSNGVNSSHRSVMCGVPQGSVLGPLLYVSFSNDVSYVIRACSFHMYADDIQLYYTSSIKNIQRCYDEVNEELKRIYDWSIAN